VTDPKGTNQYLRDVKIHVWKWSCALTSRLGAVLGRKGVDPDRGVRPGLNVQAAAMTEVAAREPGSS